MHPHALWVLYFTHKPSTLYQCEEVCKPAVKWHSFGADLFEFVSAISQKRIQRELRKQVRTTRHWLEHEWCKENARRIVLPKKDGAGKVSAVVNAGAFATDIQTHQTGQYRGKQKYPIISHRVIVTLPRNWNFVDVRGFGLGWDARQAIRDRRCNVAFPNGRHDGQCMRLVRSRGYSMKWERGYCFKGHYVGTLEWSREVERKVIARLVANRIAATMG